MILGQAAPASRLGIYFFYDADGIVDDYVVHMLEELRPHLSDLIVVCNGKLDPSGRSKLEGIPGTEVLARPNVGFDVWAYKAALDHMGWDRLVGYDEIILQNFTIMGPVNSLGDMFESMDERDVDFWGMTIHNGATFDPWGTMPDGYIPVHLQSHFIAVRQKMVASPEFQLYWDTMGPINSYTDAVSKHEAIFTQHFADMGFTWDVYVDTRDLIGKMYYPLFNVPVELIKNRRCPVFKRKSFFAAPPAYLEENSNRPARELFDFLRAEDRFDDALLIPHLLRTCHMSDLQSSLNLYEILPTDGEHGLPDTVGALAFVDSLTTAREVFPYLRHLTGADLTVVVDDQPGLLSAVEALLAASSITAALVTGTSALAALPLLVSYDVACVVDVTGESPVFPFTVNDALSAHNRASTLASRAYVRQVVDTFTADPYLGMLVPTPPVHSRHYGDLGHEWDATFAIVDEHLTALNLTVLRDARHYPIAPVGGAFWFRPSAVSPLVDAITSGLIAVPDTSTTHQSRELLALRQMLPLVVQSAGQFVSYVSTADLAGNQLTNLTHYVREINRIVGNGDGEPFTSLAHNLGHLLTQARSGPQDVTVANLSTIYWDHGGGYVEEERLELPHPTPRGSDEPLVFEFRVPAQVNTIRFDPIEGSECVCVGLRVESESPLEITPVNGTVVGDMHFFPTTDPQYLITGDLVEGTSVRIVVDELHLSAMAPRVLERLAIEAGKAAAQTSAGQRRTMMRSRKARPGVMAS